MWGSRGGPDLSDVEADWRKCGTSHQLLPKGTKYNKFIVVKMRMRCKAEACVPCRFANNKRAQRLYDRLLWDRMLHRVSGKRVLSAPQA